MAQMGRNPQRKRKKGSEKVVQSILKYNNKYNIWALFGRSSNLV